jgi:hypothetical protein
LGVGRSVFSGSVYPRWRLKEGGDDRLWSAQERGEQGRGIDAALLRGAQHRGEHLLGLGPARGTVAAPTHLAGHHRGTECLFGAPIGGIERRVKQKAEDGVVLAVEMRSESADRRDATAPPVQEPAEPLDKAAAGHC